MTPPPPFKLCLTGLPSTGKTTFIAALWAYLTSGLEAGGFRVNQYPADARYLTTIAEAWAAGYPMPRNSLGASDRIEFVIETPEGQELSVVLPDLPGEVFRNAILRPLIDRDAADAVVSCDLVMLFVNGETANTYSAVGDYSSIRMELKPEPSQNPAALVGGIDQGGEPELRPPDDFAIERLDSDTLNTELLQRLWYLRRDQDPAPLLVVVSAWDVHESSGETPRAWLHREQPMLEQCLSEFARRARVGVVGVSAQGGNYADDASVVQHLAGNRAWACDEAGQRSSIAQPLTWYAGLGSSSG